ncbi:MAG TPA: hypothetical protein VFI90_06860 [Rubrobacter sp.]|nr:hypothetical protein [Rubrobacter sp.]
MYAVSEEAQPAYSPYWLISRRDSGQISVFTTRLGNGGEALPVFGHSEDALEFLRFAALGGDWGIREAGTGELISVLFSLCKDVERVMLDPLTGRDVTLFEGLVSMERRRFVEFLLSSAKPLVR